MVALAVFFVGASIASSKIKTLKKIGAGSITNPYIANDAVNSAKIQNGTVGTDDLADNSVTTGKISDGAVVNDDVSDSAGISGTKVSPDFGSQNMTTTGTGTFGNLWSNSLNARDGSTELAIGQTNPAGNAWTKIYSPLWTDSFTWANSFAIFNGDSVDIYGSLYLDSDSAASSDSATIATPPSEACSGAYLGRIEWVDDTNAAGAWMWICEKTGASSYGWYRIQ